MDAASADADVKLYKASAELLAELQVKLSLLLQDPQGKPRKWILVNKTAEIARLLDSFQEWPQLLDPILSDLVRFLVDAFLAYCVQSKHVYHEYGPLSSLPVEPLPRSVCKLLYSFCKVRGYKVVQRILNNEPRYIEPILVCFHQWSTVAPGSSMVFSWEERYMMLLWLSHLMLAPFRLDSISDAVYHDKAVVPELDTIPLPSVARTLLQTGLQHLCIAGKERDAASLLVMRLVLREDMQRLGLLNTVFRWSLERLLGTRELQGDDQYSIVGILTLTFKLTSTASSSEVAPFLVRIFETCKQLATSGDEHSSSARQSAPSRKLLIKIVRSSLLHTMFLADNGSEEALASFEEMLEDGIQLLLEWLADSDTPVRQAASKALGIIVLKLEKVMATEVIDAVLSCLNDNMLLQNRQTGQLSAATDLFNIDLQLYKKNVNAVDPLKWHGVMLTLGHVLFRRSSPPEQLPTLLDALLMGIAFEQRSNTGTSLGVGVRDAACFGIWSLARKYTTTEINAAKLSPTHMAFGRSQSTLQIIAIELVTAACFDPSGNIRRGSSAALQELIGRHPDQIFHGISVVQHVDYHSVARRSRAMSEVAIEVSNLDEAYHISLLHSLLDWRGCRAVDAESRRQAADAVAALFVTSSERMRVDFSRDLVTQISDLQHRNVGANAAARHGILCAVASIFERSQDRMVYDLPKSLLNLTHDIENVIGSLDGRTTTDLAMVMEATTKLLAAFLTTAALNSELRSAISVDSLLSAILDRCTTATEDDLVCSSAAIANVALFHFLDDTAQVTLLKSWLPAKMPLQKSTYTCKGRIASMSRIVSIGQDIPHLRTTSKDIITYLCDIISSKLSIEKKVVSMNAIARILKSKAVNDPELMFMVFDALEHGLHDYTIDQRGDIGSLLRLASIDAIHGADRQALPPKKLQDILRLLIRLAAEKLMKVRYAAANCLQAILVQHPLEDTISLSIQHQTDVSSEAYFARLMPILLLPDLRSDVLQGLVSSMAGGSEDISQAAMTAFILFIQSQSSAQQQGLLTQIVGVLLGRLKLLAKQEDREVVPLLDTLCLVIEQYPEHTAGILVDRLSEIEQVIDVLQTPVADIARIQGLMRLSLAFAPITDFNLFSKDKISRKLLHKWPKVRQAAADAAYMLDPAAMDITVSWNDPPLNNKAKVVELRRALGVAGQARS